MSNRQPRQPKYRHHKPSNRAVVSIAGKDRYLGRYNSPQSWERYRALMAEWNATGGHPPETTEQAISVVMVPYVEHVQRYYQKDGKITTQVGMIKNALRPLKELYGSTLAKDFGPLALRAVRQRIIESGICRSEVNRRVELIRQFFRWGVSNELIPESVYSALMTVEALAKGRCDVREAEPVGPVADALVDAIEPHAPRRIWAMVQLQRLTGARPGEIVLMRTRDVDTSGSVWSFIPHSHKTEHRNRDRLIHIGPRAQAILRPWLRLELDAYVFSPADTMAEVWATRSENAVGVPGRARRRRAKRKPKREFGPRYTSNSYRSAIVRACDAAFPHPTLATVPESELTPEQLEELRAWRRDHRWHPNQLRHNAGTALRKEFGLDATRAVLGHASPKVTEIYAERDDEVARTIMGKIG